MDKSFDKEIIRRSLVALNLKKINDIAMLTGISQQNLNGYINRGTFLKVVEPELYKRKININWIKTGQVRKALARACKKAEVKRHVYPHLFRHSVATFLMGKNINMRVIQGYMGHSKIGTTEFYTHVAVENLREAENAIMTAYNKVRNTKVKAQ